MKPSRSRCGLAPRPLVIVGCRAAVYGPVHIPGIPDLDYPATLGIDGIAGDVFPYPFLPPHRELESPDSSVQTLGSEYMAESGAVEGRAWNCTSGARKSVLNENIPIFHMRRAGQNQRSRKRLGSSAIIGAYADGISPVSAEISLEGSRIQGPRFRRETPRPPNLASPRLT
jgi:hypothetical protein